MKTKTYVVHLATKSLKSFVEDDFERFVNSLRLVPELIEPVPALNVVTGVLRLTAVVTAANEEAAFRRAIRAFKRILSNLSLPTHISEIVVEEDDDLSHNDRHELLTGAEVGRRLGLSRERVRQLAADRTRFPPPILAIGKAFVWQWGDVLDWAALEQRRVPRAKRERQRGTAIVVTAIQRRVG